MTPDERAVLHLRDILTYSRHVQSFLAGVSREQFDSNTEKQFAVVRALEVIGEAAKNVTPRYRDLIPNVPWKQISGMRDKLIHQYFGVRYDTVGTLQQERFWS